MSPCFQDGKMAENADIALDRQSNIRLFERLANPHMLDDRRLEEIKQVTLGSDMPFRLPRGVVLERDESPVPTEIDLEEEEENVTEASSRHSSARSSQHSGRSNRSSVRSSNRSDYEVPDPEDFEINQSARSSACSSTRSSARSSARSSNRIDRKHHRFNNQQDVAPRIQGPPLPRMEDDELNRLRSRLETKGPSLMHMREQHQLRQQQRAITPEQQEDYRAPSGYDALFRKVCQMRKRGGVASGGSNSTGEYRPMNDPDYAEKRELLIKLDEMRTLGFNVPKMDAAMPLEDLQTEITRRTVSMGTVELVDTVIGYICSAATVLETVNNMAGPFLPMENYAQSVRSGTQTPRFKYAMYQLVLRYQGRNAGSPWRVVLMVLLTPLIQGALIKLIQWLAKGRVNLSPGMIGTGLKSLFSFGGNGNKDDASKGVPAGIPGISPEIRPEARPEPPKSSAAPVMNPFASFFRTAAQAQEAPKVPTTLPPTSTAAPADGPVTRPRRARLQRPSEITGESEVGVVTADQLK